MKIVDVAIAIVCQENQILICQRGPDGPLAGYWEFPGGKREENETLQQCLHRELHEELAITATVLRSLPCIEHAYPHAQVRLNPFICRLQSGDPQPLAGVQFRWIHPTELVEYRFPPANDDLIPRIIALLTQNGSGDGI
ncbi:MAG: 8-oxo-dGTP diphosphatase MutT [Phycisphaerales bacterium]|nr:8-oxo-dGTP diphosphatase MutT [Phycisphaerales bacterium]